MNWKMLPARKHLLIIVVYAILAGCAAMKPAYEREFDEFADAVGKYVSLVSDSSGKNTNSDEAYFNELFNIATKFHQQHLARLYRMMGFEELLYRRGLPNNFQALKARYYSGDKRLVNEAEAYEVDALAQNKCSSFGFAPNSPGFNKCVYDFKVQHVQLQMQQQQLLMQTMRPAPIVVPSTTQTNCINTWGGGIQCKSTGY